jgi:hypothetical protein
MGTERRMILGVSSGREALEGLGAGPPNGGGELRSGGPRRLGSGTTKGEGAPGRGMSE